MGKRKQTKKFAATKRLLSKKDTRAAPAKTADKSAKPKQVKDATRSLPSVPTAMFFKYNTQLGPPYRVLIDTNFINFAIQNKLADIPKAMMDCLLAKAIPCITDCVMAELEKLGSKFAVALRIAKDPRFERLPCTHRGTYADDCLVERVQRHKCYMVATCDKDLRRRLRKVPGVPIMYIASRKFTIERLPDVSW